MNRTGLFGGTFNPIHRGHLAVAREVREQFALDRVIFIPSALPPHKRPDNLADAAHRIRMTHDAVSGHQGFAVSDIELKRTGPSYSIDTILHFKRTSSPDSRLFFILGIDAFLEINTWKSFRDLFALIPFIVITRPGTGHQKALENRAIIGDYLGSRVSDGYQHMASESTFVDPVYQPVHVYGVTPMDISSTIIRRYVREGRSIQSLVAKNVEAYIQTRGLYR